MAPRHAQPEQNPAISTAYHQPPGQGDTHGIDMRGTSDTRGQVQQQVEQDVDQEIEGKGFWPKLFATLTRDHTVQGRIDSQMHDQASALSQDVQTRQAPAMSCSNYQACPHPDLKTMVTEQVSPETIGDMGELWINAGNQMVEFQTEVAGAISNSEADWRGKGGDAARKFMADIGNWVGQAGQSAQLAGTQAQRYSGALSTAKNTMPEPVEFDVDQANAELNKITDPGEYMTKYNGYMSKYQAQQDAHQQAAQILGTYDSNLGGASTMPAFAAPPAMTGDSGGSDKPKVNPGDGERPGKQGNATLTAEHTGGFTNTGTGTGTGFGPATGSGVVTPRPPSDGGSRPPGNGTAGQGYRPGGGGNQSGGLNNPGSDNPGVMPIGPGMGFGPGGSDFTRGGGGSGFGPGGSGGSGGGRGGLGGGTAGRGGLGPGGGAGVGGLAAEHAAAGRGASGGRGAAGMGGMGSLGAGRGEGGEDEEHQRPSYLVEPDPDSTFGTNEVTAPPVIGA